MKAAWRAASLAALAYAVAVAHIGLREALRDAAREASATLHLAVDDVAGELSQEQVERFHKDGFVIVRGLLPEETIKVLYEHRPRSMFPLWLWPVDMLFGYLSSSKVSIDAIWAESSLFRRFWFEGPVPRAVSQLMQDRPVRLLTDIVYGIPKGSRPTFLGKWHKDSTSFDIVERESAHAISAWIPLVDIHAETSGGSIFMGNMSVVRPDCQAQPDDDCSAECMDHLDDVAFVASFRRGDVLLFTDQTFHRSQPLGNEALVSDRFSLVGRFVQGDAVYANSASLEKQRKNFCNHGLGPGDPIHTPCFPQVFPRVGVNTTALTLPGGGAHVLANVVDNVRYALGL